MVLEKSWLKSVDWLQADRQTNMFPNLDNQKNCLGTCSQLDWSDSAGALDQKVAKLGQSEVATPLSWNILT